MQKASSFQVLYRSWLMSHVFILLWKSFGFEDCLLNWASLNIKILIHAGNASGIQIGANPVFHEYTKHIKVDSHFIGDAYDQDIITRPQVPSNLQKCWHLHQSTHMWSLSIHHTRIDARSFPNIIFVVGPGVTKYIEQSFGPPHYTNIWGTHLNVKYCTIQYRNLERFKIKYLLQLIIISLIKGNIAVITLYMDYRKRYTLKMMGTEFQCIISLSFNR